MRLGVFVQAPGHHVGGWRHPDAVTDRLAQPRADAAHRGHRRAGKFDMFFLGDGFATGYGEHPSTIGKFEPLTFLVGAGHGHVAARPRRHRLDDLCRALSRRPRLRLARPPVAAAAPAGTWSRRPTPKSAPFRPPSTRRMTSATRIAEEFVEACRALWDSWDDDAFIARQDGGRFVRPGQPPHAGLHAASTSPSTGALNVPRSPQGHPVLIQAGSSGPGQALAARFADVVFTAQNDLAEARPSMTPLKAQLVGFGRTPDSARSCRASCPVVGRTEAEAQAIFAELNRNIDTARPSPCCRSGSAWTCRSIRLDGPVPELPATEHLRAARRSCWKWRGATISPCGSSTIASPRRAAICC